MNHVGAIVGSSSATFVAQKLFHPARVSGCKLWTDDETLARTASDGDLINTWQDYSGNFSLYQNTTSRMPLAELDSNGVLRCRYDGGDDWLVANLPTAIGTDGFWQFWLGFSYTERSFYQSLFVASTDNTNTPGRSASMTPEVWTRCNSGNYASGSQSVVDGTDTLHTVSVYSPPNSSTSSIVIELDANDITNGSAGSATLNLTSTLCTFGRGSNETINGAAYSHGLYSPPPSLEDRVAIRDYAMKRAKMI